MSVNIDAFIAQASGQLDKELDKVVSSEYFGEIENLADDIVTYLQTALDSSSGVSLNPSITIKHSPIDQAAPVGKKVNIEFDIEAESSSLSRPSLVPSLGGINNIILLLNNGYAQLNPNARKISGEWNGKTYRPLMSRSGAHFLESTVSKFTQPGVSLEIVMNK